MSRAQSTVLGTIMLVAVVVVTLATFGAFSFASVPDDGGPVVDLSASMTATELRVVHTGGDGMETGSLTVQARHDDTETTYAFADGSLAGDGDERYEPGERWTVAHGLSVEEGDRVRVLVVHDNRTVVLDATRILDG